MLPVTIPRQGNAEYFPLDWATLANPADVVYPSDQQRDDGLDANSVIDEGNVNWLWRHWSRGMMRAIQNYASTSEGLYDSWLPSLPGGFWSQVGVNSGTMFLADAGAPNLPVATDVWIRVGGELGATRMQVSVGPLDAISIQASSDNYVAIPLDVATQPTCQHNEVQVVSVGVGDPQPPTPLGTVIVWRVETDGNGDITDQESVIPTLPRLGRISTSLLDVDVLNVLVSMRSEGTSNFAGPVEVESGGSLRLLPGVLGFVVDPGVPSVFAGSVQMLAGLQLAGALSGGSSAGTLFSLDLVDHAVSPAYEFESVDGVPLERRRLALFRESGLIIQADGSPDFSALDMAYYAPAIVHPASVSIANGAPQLNIQAILATMYTSTVYRVEVEFYGVSNGNNEAALLESLTCNGQSALPAARSLFLHHFTGGNPANRGRFYKFTYLVNPANLPTIDPDDYTALTWVWGGSCVSGESLGLTDVRMKIRLASSGEY